MSPVLTRPNFLFINTDPQRYDTLGCNGSQVARTPNLDRLAEQAVRCLITEQWKYVHWEGCDFGEPYDRRSDPEEFENLHADPAHSATVRAMRDRLLSFLIESDPTPPRTDIFCAGARGAFFSWSEPIALDIHL